MDLKIIPSICLPKKDKETGAEIAPAEFQGHVKIRLPEMPAVFRFKAKYGKEFLKRRDTVELAKTQTKELSDETFQRVQLETMEIIAQIAEDIKGHWSEIDLIEVKTGKHISSVDELYTTEACFEVISEIGIKFIEGFAEKNS